MVGFVMSKPGWALNQACRKALSTVRTQTDYGGATANIGETSLYQIAPPPRKRRARPLYDLANHYQGGNTSTRPKRDRFLKNLAA
jgi:hypothetical protein